MISCTDLSVHPPSCPGAADGLRSPFAPDLRGALCPSLGDADRGKAQQPRRASFGSQELGQFWDMSESG